MSFDLEARVSALESIQNKYLPKINSLMAKTQEKDKTEKPKDLIVEKDLETKVDPIVDPDPDDQEVEAIIEGKGHGPVGLLAPAYDVMYKGNFVHVTSEMLVNDPELLAYMRKEFPECFVK